MQPNASCVHEHWLLAAVHAVHMVLHHAVFVRACSSSASASSCGQSDCKISLSDTGARCCEEKMLLDAAGTASASVCGAYLQHFHRMLLHLLHRAISAL